MAARPAGRAWIQRVQTWCCFLGLLLCWLQNRPPRMAILASGLKPQRFSEHANWLLPGHLMIGRYPYLNPVYCTSQREAVEQLHGLLKVGITTFVCLQTEIPPQVGPASEEWPADGVPVTGFPGRFLPYAAKAQSLMPDLQFMHCPIQDLSTPRSRELSELVGELMQRMEANEVIYLHCWGGRGRSGVVAACLLGSMFGEMTAAECLEMVQCGYSSRGSKADVGALAKSPQTDEQRQFVKLSVWQFPAIDFQDMRQQQRALQDLKFQFERSLNQLAEQLQEVVRSHSRLQTEINAAQARPHVEPGYSSALRTLTGNVEDLKSLMEHSPLHGRNRIDSQAAGAGGAASPQTLRPTTSPAASSTGAFHFSAQAFCAKCGSQHAADEIFCRKCGHKREQASAQEAALVEVELTDINIIVFVPAGFRLADLASAGASIRNLRTAGFTDVASVVALRKRGVQAWKLKLGGFTLSDLRSAGYSSAELRLAGFSSASLVALEKCRAWNLCKANAADEEQPN
ncbi:unnamed protein product [Symbiodinium sp. CCMP2592]|nr:unnamed protein product [Symbiodinium sp. CCMP2592]